LLLMMAWLIEHAKEGEEPTEHEGYCYASIKYLAQSLGCSESAVEKWVNSFVADRWLKKEQLPRDNNGHQHNRYCLAIDALDRLEALKRIRGEERPKNPNKRRPTVTGRVQGKFARGCEAAKARVASGHGAGSQPRLAARSGKAKLKGAGEPSGSERNSYPLGAGEGVRRFVL
jgi:hypothetical protein